jgi:hypothetical protein
MAPSPPFDTLGSLAQATGGLVTAAAKTPTPSSPQAGMGTGPTVALTRLGGGDAAPNVEIPVREPDNLVNNVIMDDADRGITIARLSKWMFRSIGIYFLLFCLFPATNKFHIC